MATRINIRVHLEKNIYSLASDDIGYLSAYIVSPMRIEMKSTLSIDIR